MDRIFNTARARADANEEIADSQRRVDRRRGYKNAQYNRLSRRLARVGLRSLIGLAIAVPVFEVAMGSADKDTSNRARTSKTTVDLIKEQRAKADTQSHTAAFGDSSNNTLAGQ